VQRSQQLWNLTILSVYFQSILNSPPYMKVLFEHLRILLQCLGALYFVPGGTGSIWYYIEVLWRLTQVSGMLACGFQTI